MTAEPSVLDDRVPTDGVPMEHTADNETIEYQCPRWARRERDARDLCEAMPTLNYRIDLTLKYQIVTASGSVENITEAVIRHQLIRFMNRLNGSVLNVSRKMIRPPKIDALIVLEHTAPGDHHPHLHGLVERPPHIGVDRFRVLVERAWCHRPIANTEKYLQPVENLLNSIRYNMKDPDYRIVYYHRERDETAFWRHKSINRTDAGTGANRARSTDEANP